MSTSPSAAGWAGASRRSRQAAGCNRALDDALIAGIAIDLDAIVTTRNRKDLVQQGVLTLEY